MSLQSVFNLNTFQLFKEWPNETTQEIIALFLRQVTKGLILLEVVRWECKKRMSFENVIMRYCKPHFTFLFDNTVCGVFFKQTILWLAFEWKWGWCWLCFDRNLTASLSCKFPLISHDYFYRVMHRFVLKSVQHVQHDCLFHSTNHIDLSTISFLATP